MLKTILSVTLQRQSTPCLLQYANNNRNQGRFNDVTIVSGDTSIPANRMVLSCYCSFFDQYFASQTNNQVSDSIVDIPDVDEKLLELVIQYIYTGQICIDSDNVLDILATAHHLELNEVKQFCFEFLENCITPDNYITILITAKQYKNFDLRDKVYKYISGNFKTITQTPAFLNLDNAELFFIVYHLKTKFGVNDAVLCRSLLSWTKHDEETRKEHLKRLTMFVDVEQLSDNLIRKLLREDVISQTLDFSYLLNTRTVSSQKRGTSILSSGGLHTVNTLKSVYNLSSTSNIIRSFSDLPIPLTRHRLLATKDLVYCVGGRIKNKNVSNKLFALNLTESAFKWKELASMRYKRDEPAAAFLNGSLVVCGGHLDGRYVRVSEAYDVELNKWRNISPLQQSRYTNQAVSCGGCLYAVGGMVGNNTSISSVERLDGLDQSWHFVSSMQTPRRRFAAVEFDDAVYAVGGLDNNGKSLSSVEKYDCDADKWTYVKNMNVGRWGHSANIMGNKIYVVGGLNEKDEAVREIECYEPPNDTWEFMALAEDALVLHSTTVV